MFKTTAAAAAVSSLLIAAAPADAKTFRGKTNQGRTASLTTGADGVPTRVRVAWRAPASGTATARWARRGSSRPFTSVSADEVTDRAKTYRVELDGGLRGRITVDLVVKRSGDRWIGTLGVRELFARKGRVTDVCEVKRVRFTLS